MPEGLIAVVGSTGTGKSTLAIKIAKELWLILSGTEQENIDQYLLEVENSVKAFRKAKDINERIEASRNISDLISRL